MGFEDYFAAFTTDSHPAFTVAPATGRMDRRGGETTLLSVTCDPRGHPVDADLKGTLVINVPEDDSKLTYVFEAVRG